jgi:predicted anti-sigma-YlaC factor YlaD
MGRGFVGAELEAHVASCPSCGELRVVAGALLDERAQAIIEAPVPSAGTMLWRMRARRRQEAEATARRSLLIGQALTLAIAITLVISFFGTELTFAVRDLIATIRLSTPLLVVLAVWLLGAPIAGWVALRQK